MLTIKKIMVVFALTAGLTSIAIALPKFSTVSDKNTVLTFNMTAPSEKCFFALMVNGHLESWNIVPDSPMPYTTAFYVANDHIAFLLKNLGWVKENADNKFQLVKCQDSNCDVYTFPPQSATQMYVAQKSDGSYNVSPAAVNVVM